MIDPPSPSELRRQGGLKWTYYDEGVHGAWVAEMDFGLAPAIASALHDAVDRADTAYPYPLVADKVAVAASRFWRDRFGWDVDPKTVYPVPDVLVGLSRAITHLTRPGSAVVLHTPVYFPFFGAVEGTGREMIEVPSLVDSDGFYRIDIDQVARAFSEGAGSIVLCNPWNPTGRVLSEGELDRLLDMADSHGARVISDEIHSSLVFDGSTHLVAAARAPETVVTITSASKAWNLPGLKCAQVVLTNDDDRAVWEDYFTGDKVGVGTFGLIANLAAYSDSVEWLDDVMVKLSSNRKLLGDLMDSLLPEVGYRAPEATYLAWLDFRPQGLDLPAKFFIDHGGVALTEGEPFGEGGAGHARLNFATTPEILTEVVERLAAAL